MSAPGVHESGHTAQWKDGLKVTRVMTHRKQIVLYLHWQGRHTTLRLGPRTIVVEESNRRCG